MSNNFRRRAMYDKYLGPELTTPHKHIRKTKVEILKSVSDMLAHIFENEMDNEYNFSIEQGEAGYDNYYVLHPSQSISLNDVLAIVEKNNLSKDEVFFTVSRQDDHINLELVRATKMSFEEEEKEYRENLEEWKNKEKSKKEKEIKNLEKQIRQLQENIEEQKRQLMKNK